jgi:hypothetical protein
MPNGWLAGPAAKKSSKTANLTLSKVLTMSTAVPLLQTRASTQSWQSDIPTLKSTQPAIYGRPKKRCLGFPLPFETCVS